MNSGTVGILIFAIVLIIGGAILLAVVTRSQKQLNKQEYRTKWLKVESSLKKTEESSYHLAILNADKLLDAALKELGYRGQTMGDRMKSAKVAFSNNNSLWSAHKLRNRIAHETDVKIGYTATRRALASFKQGLKDLGAI
ncbi:hypothetical protein GX865_01515 [Candidatus Saccharibacteria bacterium]|jgi:uncharacterized membrane protein|nr:hypothetical protein [Candidatus Saccharibacteria bacterium]